MGIKHMRQVPKGGGCLGDTAQRALRAPREAGDLHLLSFLSLNHGQNKDVHTDKVAVCWRRWDGLLS